MSTRKRTRAEKALAHYNRAVDYGFRFGGVASRVPVVRADVRCYCGNTPAVGSPSVNRDAIHLAEFRDAYPDLPLAELVIKHVSIRQPRQAQRPQPPQPPQPRRQCHVTIQIDDVAGADRYHEALARYVTGQLGNNYRCITGDANNSVEFEIVGDLPWRIP
jgi:hypothetical protein